jgi:hypothetical protein
VTGQAARHGSAGGATDPAQGSPAAPGPTQPGIGLVAPGATSGAGSSVATTGGTGQPTGPTGSPVLHQVLTEVPRLVSRGDGTHRITLRLHPADLGELRLTVTVKDGAVDVTLAAGRAAREALRDGSSQLRSLLELTGHTAGQLVIRDLPGSGTATAAQPGAPTTAPGTQQPTGPGQHGQQPAGFGQHGEPGRQQGRQTGPTQPASDRAAGMTGPPDREPQSHAHPRTRGSAAAVDVRI